MSFDLDAAVAAESSQPFEFTYRGQSFSLPLSIPLSTIQALKNVDQDDLSNILITLLGADQGQRFVAFDPTDVEIKLLIEEYTKVKGVSLGEALK